MNCTSFELEAQRLIDERTLALPAELREHAAGCSACRAFWSAQMQLIAVIRSAAIKQAPPGLVDAVLQKLRALPTAPQTAATSRLRLAAALCSTAALALVTVSLVRWTTPQQPSSAAIVHTSSAITGDSEALLASQSLTRLWNGMHAEYQEFSQETSQALDRFAELPRPAAVLPSVAPLESSPTGSPESWLRVDRPISERVEAAFDFLWDALPSDSAHSL